MARQLFEYHPLIGYRFIPNLKVRIPHESGGYLVRVNETGFRSNREFTKEKPKNINRVILFGDSYTAGEGVSNQYRYSDVLERSVSNIEVYNFGLPGSGTDQQYLIYREFAKDIKHDITIIAVLVENIRRVAARYRVWNDDRGLPVLYDKPYFELADGEITLKNVPPRKKALHKADIPVEEQIFIDRGGRFPEIEKLVSRLGIKDLVQSIVRYQPVPEYNRADNHAWQLMSKILEKWINNLPGKVILMPIPLYQHLEGRSDPSKYQARFDEVAKATGCFLYDPLKDLTQYSKRQRRQFRFKKDVHLTHLGHSALADCIAPVIKKMISSPAGKD